MSHITSVLQTLVMAALPGVFLILFLQEAYAILRSSETIPQSNSRDQIWTATSAILAGATAILMGVHLDSKFSIGTITAEGWRAIYAAVYIGAGIFALVISAVKSDRVTPMMKSLGTAFLGLAVAVGTGIVLTR